MNDFFQPAAVTVLLNEGGLIIAIKPLKTIKMQRNDRISTLVDDI